MPRKIVTALFFALALTTGCSQTMNEVNAGSVKAKINPHPQQRYELTFTVHDAPGSFDSVTGEITYEVWNEGCVPTDSISGAHSRTPGLRFPIALTRINENIYKGEVDLDLPLDEDYFGLGVCHWKPNGAVIRLKAHGVEFSSDINQDDIMAQRNVPTYFLKEYYYHPPEINYSGGGANQENYDKMSDRSKYFPTDIVAKRISS